MLAAKGLMAAAVGWGLAFGAPAPFPERAINIPPGTSIPITVDRDIPIQQEQFGQTFPAHVTRDVTIDSKVSIPEGTPARVRLVPSSETSDNVTLQLVEL